MDRREDGESINGGLRVAPRAVRQLALGAGRWARRSPLSVDVLIAIGLGVAGAPWTVWALAADDGEAAMAGAPAVTAPWFALTLAAVAVGHAGLAWRRVRPITSFLVVAFAVGVQTCTTPWLLLPSMLVILPSLYAVAAYGRGRRRPALGPAVGVLVAVAGTLTVMLIGVAIAPSPPTLPHPLVYGLFYLFPVLLAAWTLGLLRRTRLTYAARMAELEQAERVRRAVTAERTRIAREMHDVIAHALSVVVSQANGGRYAARSDPDRAVQILSTIARTGQQALADTRGMLAMLRTDTPVGGLGLPAVQPTVEDLPELLERVRAAGMVVRMEEHGGRRPLATPVQLAVYRVVQEALTNSLKHAGLGVQSKVSLTWHPDGLEVAVTDDGRGAGMVDREGGQGLIGMRERVDMIGGTVSAGPLPGGGFGVRAWLPDNVQDEQREDGS